MKHFSILISVVVLILASLACQTVLGGGSEVDLPDSPPANPSGGEPGEGNQPPANPQSGGSDSLKSDFPIPPGAKNMTDIGGSLNFRVDMSVREVADYYLSEMKVQGYTERSILTSIEDTTFSMVFDGHKSGIPVVTQGVDLGDGTTNVNIRLEDF